MKKQHSAKVPFMLKLMRKTIYLLTRISPYLAARVANYLWFKTQRNTEPKRETKFLKSAQWQKITVGQHTIQLYTWGDRSKPTVLLVHGWNGRAAQLGAFALELVDKGYCVIGFDSPAHGRSTGKQTNLPTISRVIQAIDRQHGPFAASITHSFGGMCLMHAIAEGVVIDKVSCISPASNIDLLVNIFASILQIEPKVEALQRQLLEKQFGADVWQKFSIPEMLRSISPQGLIVHDQHDKDIPLNSGELVADAWQDSEIFITEKLGHRRILRDTDVIEKVTTYIHETQATEASS